MDENYRLKTFIPGRPFVDISVSSINRDLIYPLNSPRGERFYRVPRIEDEIFETSGLDLEKNVLNGDYDVKINEIAYDMHEIKKLSLPENVKINSASRGLDSRMWKFVDKMVSYEESQSLSPNTTGGFYLFLSNNDFGKLSVVPYITHIEGNEVTQDRMFGYVLPIFDRFLSGLLKR
ncbi:MAG: hypothetical protein PVJ67_06425 [Candidatus Pacearchaeota archaeon]|jgi:hypothetical protein